MRNLIVGAVLAILSLHAAPLSRTPSYGYKVIHTYPHDRYAFTQGLEFRGGFLYEGTGLNGRSSIRKVDLESGRILQETPLDPKYFGEGITLFDRRLIQLTWQGHRGFLYDVQSFRPLGEFEYPGEGWGLTHDARQIYMSDGSSEIRCWNPKTFAETRRIAVRDKGMPTTMLNELEFVRGEIYANVWQTDNIVRISPSDGHVTGWIDLSGLLTADEAATADVLNGIAWDASHDRLFVTGKLWPKLFEIRLVRRS
ncbi:MAG TPA: glutaminyl-peptide cyclotransferase [Bryobacteraceae bacterium]|nr:glutaminyl-peptide cyclotransferase [Bryobacteraceae bacterium]